MAQHYDVAVIGGQVAGVIAAALLAKRGRRVLLLDHGENATTYTRRGFLLPLAPGILPQLENSPAMHRVHDELGLAPVIRTEARLLSPSFQAILPRHRFDIASDPEALVAEIAKEFPREAPAASAFFTRLLAADDEMSAFLRDSSPLAPRTAWQWWRSRSLHARTPFLAQPFAASSWLAGLDADHPLRAALLSPLHFFGHLALETPSTLLAVRLLARYYRGVVTLADRHGGLRAFLLRAARQAGVEIRMGAVAKVVHPDGRTLRQLEIEDDKQLVTADYFVASTLGPFHELLAPSPRQARLAIEEQSVRAAGSLLVLNLVVDRDVIPCGLAESAFVLNGRCSPRGEAPPDPPLLILRQPAARADAGRKSGGTDDPNHEVLSVVFPVRTGEIAHSPERLAAIRTQMVRRVGRIVPFLDEYVRDTSLATDTAGWDLETEQGTRRIDPWQVHPFFETAKPPWLGVSARSPRTYFKNLWRCGHDIVPGLGIEGDYIAGLATVDGIVQDAGRRWRRL